VNGSRICGGSFDIEGKRARLTALEQRAGEPGFWDDREAAEALGRERAALQRVLEAFDAVSGALEDHRVLLDLGEEEGDESVVEEVRAALPGAEERLRSLELQRMLSGPQDGGNAIVSVNAGAGGIDAQDWAEMLLRMYLHYCDRQRFQTSMIDYQPGDEAGLKSATFSVAGENAYGYLKAEIGVHRLVRISPFDAQHRRHTAFASVAVYPEVDDDIEIEIAEKDLRIDTYRSGGAGGQHVNKTDSAVRLTHLPTGIVVQCQNERSQHKNKAMAMKVLPSRLYDRILEERASEAEAEHALKKKIEWGSQIRSYVLQPYQMVKDLRTDVQTGNVERVLDGEIHEFVEAFLLQYAEDTR